MAIESVNGAANAVNQQVAQQSEQSQMVQPAKQSPEIEKAANTNISGSSVSASIQEQTDLSVERLEETVEKLNELMRDGQRSLSFSVDKELDEVVVKVMDTETEEIIRQIPNEETLKFAKDLEGVIGVIFNERA